MKSVIALALIGSAAAFAPSTQGPVSALNLMYPHLLNILFHLN
jgi:hypothetical protein